MFGYNPQNRFFFISKAMLNFEVYGQQDKITLKAGKNKPLFSRKITKGLSTYHIGPISRRTGCLLTLGAM